MKRLSHRDYDALLNAILELHDRASTGGLLPGATETFSKLIPCDYFAVFDAKLQSVPTSFQLRGVWESDTRLTEDLSRRMVHHFPSHPFTQPAQEANRPLALRLSDFYSMRQLRDQAFYCEFYRPAGVGRCMAIAWATPSGMFFLNANRRRTEADFDERDRLVMELARPHFEQARRESERYLATRGLGPQELRERSLTPREIEVATWLSRGKTNPEIAVILGTHLRTVEKHVERILVKLGVENRTAAAFLIRGPNQA